MNSHSFSTVWDKTNIIFTCVAAITGAMFCYFFVCCFIFPVSSISHSVALGMCGIFGSLFSAFFIAAFIRLIDMKKKQREEINAFIMSKPLLHELYSTINTFFPQITAFATIRHNTISYPTERIYYTDISKNDNNRDFIDFNIALTNAEPKLNEALEQCSRFPALFLCNNHVIHLISRLKQNKLTHILCEVQYATRFMNTEDTIFGGLCKNYEEFYECYLELVKLLGESPPINKLQKLSSDDENVYRKEIELFLLESPIENAKIYKGNRRMT